MSLQEETVVAMRLIVLWREMYDFCMSREGDCENCPYNINGVCTKASTEQVLKFAANKFDRFLES